MKAVWWASASFAALLGFSRISFGLLLPFIKHDFPANYTAYGIVAAANFAGYLVGLGLLPVLPRAWHDRRSNTIALTIIAATLAISAVAPNLTAIALARFINGVAQAVGTILTIGLAFSTIEPKLRGRASGILWGGGGVGTVISALALPYAAANEGGWRAIWIAMAAVSLIVTIGLHRNVPAHTHQTSADGPDRSTDTIAIAVLCTQYALFGAAFAMYFTYAPAYAREIIAGTLAFASAWCLTGFAGSSGAFFWGWALDRSRRGATLGLCLLLAGAGAAALVLRNPLAGGISAILVGSGSFGTPTQTSALTRHFSSGHAYVRVLSIVTLAFAVGQTLGAPLGGWIADSRGLGVSVIASALLFIAAGLTALTVVARGQLTRSP
jgi:predicted MFS family arabinose efflux permease